MHPSVSKSRNEWHSSWRLLFAGAVLRKLVTSVDTVVVAVTQKVLLHTQPVAAVPLTLSAREPGWQQTTLSSSLHSSFSPFSFICMVTYRHRRHFHSPRSSVPFTLVAFSIHFDRHFNSPWSSFLFTLIVGSVHLDRHFHSPGSSVTFTFIIVISIHLDRLHHSPWSSFPFTLIVFCIHLHRHFHSTFILLLLKFPFTLIISCIHTNCHFHRYCHHHHHRHLYWLFLSVNNPLPSVVTLNVSAPLSTVRSLFSFVVTSVQSHLHSHLHFFSPSSTPPPLSSLPLILLITSSHRLHRLFHSLSSSLPLIFIVTFYHLHCHFLSSSPSLLIFFIVTSSHLHRHFLSPSSSLPLTFIVDVVLELVWTTHKSLHVIVTYIDIRKSSSS